MATRSELNGGSAGRNGRTSPDGRRAGSLREHPNLKNIAADFIRDEIISGRFGPGAKVDQDDVAVLLGISRLPVREALIELTEKDFVTAIPRRGAFVVDLGIEDIEDHYEVLGMVFSLAARRAAKALTRNQLRDLRSFHEEIATLDDFASKADLNHQFYSTINRAGSSPRLLSILRSLSGALPARYYENAPGWEQTEAKYRDRILAALEARDADTAAETALQHLSDAAKVTIEALRGRGYWTTEADHAGGREQDGPARGKGRRPRG